MLLDSMIHIFLLIFNFQNTVSRNLYISHTLTFLILCFYFIKIIGATAAFAIPPAGSIKYLFFDEQPLCNCAAPFKWVNTVFSASMFFCFSKNKYAVQLPKKTSTYYTLIVLSNTVIYKIII